MPFLPLPPEIPTSLMDDRARTRRFGGEKIPEPKNGSPALKKIVLKACEFEPKDRLASAQDMLNALEGLSEVKEKYCEDANGSLGDPEVELNRFRQQECVRDKDLRDKSDEEKIQIVYPDWKVTRLIGRDSFGSVYEIQRIQFGKTEKAAVKVITFPYDRSIIDELHNEGYDDASISKRLSREFQYIVKGYYLMMELKGHTNVVNCDDIQYIENKESIGWDVFIKMEPLTSLYKAFGKGNGKNISDEAVIKLGKDICRSLMFCEKKNIVHRDINPHTIFRSGDGEYKLGDFSVAKTIERTASGTFTGTYKYMAPEVFNKMPYGHSVDIYSLGLVLYWLLNEKRMPFLPLPPAISTSSMEDEARAKRFGGAKIPEPKNGSPELKKIILKACEFKPKDRFASAQEMLNALEGLSGAKEKYYEDANGTVGWEYVRDEESDFSGMKMNSASDQFFSSEDEATMGNSWDDRSGTIGVISSVQRQVSREEEITVGANHSELKKEEPTKSFAVFKELPSSILDHVMDWKDDVLEAKMRTITGIHDRKIMLSDVYHLTSLDLLKEDILDKKGKNRRISNYGALLELTQIQELTFDKKGMFASASAERLVKELPNLKKVEIEDTLLNLDAVVFPVPCGLTELVYKSSVGSKLKFLKHMPDLEVLDLSGVDLNPIFGREKVQGMILGLTQLKKLKLSQAKISEISFLSSMSGLEELQLCRTGIKDISPLKNLVGLKSLSLWEDHIGDLRPLRNLLELKKLDLSCAGILNISFLASMTRLEELSLTGTGIKDISFLKFLTGLKTLHLQENNIDDLSPLQNLTSLKMLTLEGSLISDLNSLRNLSELCVLAISSPAIQDVSMLGTLPNLNHIVASGCCSESVRQQCKEIKRMRKEQRNS